MNEIKGLSVKIHFHKVVYKIHFERENTFVVVQKTKTTDPQGELITQVDKHNQVIGSISRGEAHEKQGIFYRTIYVLIKNDYGQSYKATAVRELKEELGLNVSEEDLIAMGEVLVKLPNSGEYFNVFEYNLRPSETISTSEEEINDTRWMTIVDIKRSMQEKRLRWYSRPEQVITALY